MQEWKEAKRKFYDSDYDTTSGSSFVTAPAMSISTEVYYNVVIILYAW